MSKLASGLELLEEQDGAGRAAKTGDTVEFKCRVILNRGDEVNAGLRAQRTVLGKRQVIAGVEKALIGMRVGGTRRVRVSPHLAYGDKGVEGIVPAKAVLGITVRLLTIDGPETPTT